MKYALLALTTFLTVFTALPASAGRIWVDRTRREVIVRRCLNDRWLDNNRYYEPYGDPYYSYNSCRYVIKRYPNNRKRYRVYRPLRDPYYTYPYRYPRRNRVQIRIGY
jgi:hypothetical protein